MFASVDSLSRGIRGTLNNVAEQGTNSNILAPKIV